MHNERLDAERRAALQMIESVRALYGEDEGAISSAISSETSFDEVVIQLAREVKRREGYAAALKDIIGENKARAERHERAAERLREAIGAAMMEVGQIKVESADLTIGVRQGAPGVLVTDEDRLPSWFWKTVTTRKLDLAKIKAEVLEQGQQIDGVVKTNPAPVLTIRTA